MVSTDNLKFPENLTRLFHRDDLVIWHLVEQEVEHWRQMTPFQRITEWKSWHPECTCDGWYILNEDKHRLYCPMNGKPNPD